MTHEPREPITVQFAAFKRDIESCHSIRHAVFVVEQGIDPALEFDASDTDTQSLLAYSGRTAVGTARIAFVLGNIKLGRVAVLSPWRGLGIGKAMVETVVEFAGKRRACSVVLHSQVSVVGFYERVGFATEGVEYREAGIPHITMRRVITPSPPLDGTPDVTGVPHSSVAAE